MWRYFFYPENKKLRWIFSFFSGIYIVAFYRISEPSSNSNFHYNYPLYYDIIAAIWFDIIIAFMCLRVPVMLPSYFKHPIWSFKIFNIWFLISLITTAIGAYIFDYFAHDLHKISNHWQTYFLDFQIPLDIFIALPMYFLFLIENKNWYSVPNNMNTITLKIQNNNSLPYLIDQNQKTIPINIEMIYYISSAGNYVNIYYKNEEGLISNTSIRSTLKIIEEQTQAYPYLFRCHNAFIVNTQKVIKINGNTRGYLLLLKDCSDLIPVSRSKNNLLKEYFPFF